MATYIEINIDDTSKVDFSQVNTTSSQTMRRNLANTKAIIAFDVEPSFITNGTTDIGIFRSCHFEQIYRCFA